MRYKTKKGRFKPRFYIIVGVAILLCVLLVKMIFFRAMSWSIEYETEGHLNKKAEALIEHFMEDTYCYMATWKETDLTKWFYDSGSEEALMCQAAYDLMVEMRGLRDADLTFKCKEVSVIVTDIKEENEGIYCVSMEEAYECRFPFMEEDSYSQGIVATMKIVEDGNGYKLLEYTREEDFFSYITEGYQKGHSNPQNALQNVKLQVLNEFKTELEVLAKLRDEAECKYVTCDVPYDRETATEYALTYALTRNDEEWFVFDDLGGNCQNFGSQVIHAGGVPMDIEGEAIWKYYGLEPNQGNERVGRSTSWAGVTYFYEYASKNTGFGLCSQADANIYTAEAGDIIQVGDGTGDYVHTIISLGPIKDKDGNVIDINTVSNTTDRKNYPLSAYNCPYMRLIKIYGYNN